MEGVELLNSIRGSRDPIKSRFDLSPTQISSLAAALIDASRRELDAVAASRASPSWRSTIAPLVSLDACFSVVEKSCTFPQHVSPNKEIREASVAADTVLSDFQVEASCRHDVYMAVKEFSESAEISTLSAEAKRYLEHTLRDFRRKGLHLTEELRAQVKTLNQELSQLQITYTKNLGEEDTKLSFSRDDLEGMPDDFVSSLKCSDDGRYEVTLKYPHYLPLMKLCKKDSTRQVAERAFNSRCHPENSRLLDQMTALRHRIAQLLGYPSHAAYMLEIRMAKTPDAVATFLSDLSNRLTPLQEREEAVLLELKRSEKTARNDSHDPDHIYPWEMAYYRNQVEEKHYGVDHEALKQYFPLHTVTNGLLSIYQRLLGLTFTERAGDARGVVWHDEVRVFEVSDTSSGEALGVFYLDLHPREGKFSHAACFSLQPGCDGWQLDFGDPANRGTGSSGRLLAGAACVCNFSKPAADRPSLLLHDEVETFFHEFGHVMHQLCARRVSFAAFAGTAVERDFVEAPSQMLENWVWKIDSLRLMSAHHENGAEIPDELLNKLIAARNANAGLLNKRQILLATFDQQIHSTAAADSAAELARLTRLICHYEPTPGTNMAASFGHLAGGYDAQYYGYLWSEVFSMDMFKTRFGGVGILNPTVGAAYRNEILSWGGSRDAADSLRAFLRRDPTPDAFLESKGLVA
eukprot:gnl/Spiro4/27117_TR13490_c0_g1_i1.p1 gnl/Spiro4/27117_TR13490_c0_g1~~gnl/Spiro4/27117_TR13490_c0_g1_i1.p1  ORF type:complete len:748 (+),score=216.92 gnl/Spiro4/27117_TR13490_c0_g1_i1:171-2246(+)